jgi:hypothetical protein
MYVSGAPPSFLDARREVGSPFGVTVLGIQGSGHSVWCQMETRLATGYSKGTGVSGMEYEIAESRELVTALARPG